MNWIKTAAGLTAFYFGLFRCFLDVVCVYQITNRVRVRESDLVLTIVFSAVCGILTTILLNFRKEFTVRCGPAVYPLFFPVVFLLTDVREFAIFLWIGSFMWFLYLILRREERTLIIPEKAERYLFPVLILFSLCGAGWGFFKQVDSYRRCWFRYTDWCEYFMGYLNHDIWFNSGHFNPLANLLLGGVLTCYPHPYVLFAIASLVIYSAVPIWFLLAESYKMPRELAFLFGSALLFHFTLTNLTTSIFYGYHPILFFLPLMLLFFLFRRRGRTLPALLCAAGTLLIQETTAVFWFGWGCYECALGHWKKGVAICSGSFAWFLLIVKVFSPQSGNGFGQFFHFAHFGGSLESILLSPVRQPELFFGELFDPMNLNYLFVLFLPFLPLAWKSWKLFLVLIPVCLGLFLKRGNDTLNFFMQYQTEIFTVLCAAAVIGYSKYNNRTAARAAVFASVAGLALSGCFLGEFPYGKSSFSRILNFPDASPLLEELKQEIPEGSAIQAMPRFRMHFMRRNQIFSEEDPKGFFADYILLDLTDPFYDHSKVAELVSLLAENPEYSVCAGSGVSSVPFLLYRKKSAGR